MTIETTKAEWANTAVDVAFVPTLRGEARDQAVTMIMGYFDKAAARGINRGDARAALNNELITITPVTEPLADVLKRALGGPDATG